MTLPPEDDDPRIAAIRQALEQRPALAVERTPGVAEAAVALLIRPRDDLEILLIKRAEHERDPWSGHMALPGGRRSGADADLIATAGRETEEETHVPLRRIGTLLGRLDDVAPRSVRLPPIVVTPFVHAVPSHTVARPDGREVDVALWVPLSALRDEDAVEELLVELGEGGSRAFPSLRYQEHVIWGLTHRVLTDFLSVIAAAGV
jgi:8-oxo-dGTP pyrophosphatase MutT (NUDIX family)